MEIIVKPAHIANVDFDVLCTLSLERGSITGITSDNSYGVFAMPPMKDTSRIRRIADADGTEWLSGFLRAQLSQAHKPNRHD
ncbi:hypothetical protein [Rhizobium laguerreae]